MIKSFSPDELSAQVRHEYLLGTVSPRPIAWVSTIDEKGLVNLAPFSFFNIFGSNPPILIFSPSRRVRDNTTKHTLENSELLKECVINICNYDLLGQMVLSSTEYPDGTDEFEKAGLTPIASVKINPPRVMEAPAQFECIIRDVIKTGEHGGAGNLVICEVVHMHFHESVFNEHGKPDPHKVDTISRMGGAWYSRAKEGLFEYHAPRGNMNIGFDGLPAHIRNSSLLTGNELSKLAMEASLPADELIKQYATSPVFTNPDISDKEKRTASEVWAQQLIAEEKIQDAWAVLMCLVN